MTEQELKDLKKIVFITGEYYSKTLSPEVVAMRASDLQDLNFQDVRKAYESYRRDSKNKFDPLPAQIRDVVAPVVSDESVAREVAGRIWTAVSRFGHTNPEEAHKYVGEVGWLVVGKMGGWAGLCQTLMTNERGTFLAQTRDMAKAQLELARAGQLNTAPALPEPKKYHSKDKNFASIGEAVKLGLSGKTL